MSIIKYKWTYFSSTLILLNGDFFYLPVYAIYICSRESGGDHIHSTSCSEHLWPLWSCFSLSWGPQRLGGFPGPASQALQPLSYNPGKASGPARGPTPIGSTAISYSIPIPALLHSGKMASISFSGPTGCFLPGRGHQSRTHSRAGQAALCGWESERLLGTGWEIQNEAQLQCVLGTKCWLHVHLWWSISHTLLKCTPSCMYITAHWSLHYRWKSVWEFNPSTCSIQEPRPWVPRS